MNSYFNKFILIFINNTSFAIQTRCVDSSTAPIAVEDLIGKSDSFFQWVQFNKLTIITSVIRCWIIKGILVSTKEVKISHTDQIQAARSDKNT